MQKKGIVMVISLVVLVLAVGGIGYLYLNKSKTALKTPTTATPQKSTAENVFSSIQDALSKSISLSCNFTDQKGRKTTSYIKNGSVRADIVALKPEESGSVIVKDKKIYFWNDKGGFMVDISSKNITNGVNQAESQQKDMMDSLEKYKSSCKVAVVPDSLFVPPTDVKFQDLLQMMITAPKVPSINQNQIQEMLKKYAAPSQPAQ